MTDWDILNLYGDDKDWPHKEILQRLHDYNIDCYAVDMFGEELAWIIGCWLERNDESRIARALNIPKDVIYMDWEHGIVFLNLYQLKVIRGIEP